jgi:hypothetical protein
MLWMLFPTLICFILNFSLCLKGSIILLKCNSVDKKALRKARVLSQKILNLPETNSPKYKTPGEPINRFIQTVYHISLINSISLDFKLN